MSASNEVFQYHLTLSGWVTGSEKIDFSGWEERPIPEGRLLTVSFREHMSSGFSGIDFTADVQTFGSKEAIARALTEHGTDPYHASKRSVGWPEFVSAHQG